MPLERVNKPQQNCFVETNVPKQSLSKKFATHFSKLFTCWDFSKSFFNTKATPAEKMPPAVASTANNTEKLAKKASVFPCCCVGSGPHQPDKNTIIGYVPQEIMKQLPPFQELSPNHYVQKKDLGKEVVYEILVDTAKLGWNAVIADIQQSVPHFHKRTTEVYTVLTGQLEVFINDKSHILNPGDVITIPLNSVHWGRSLTDTPARIICTCVPAWCPEDHHIVRSAQ